MKIVALDPSLTRSGYAVVDTGGFAGPPSKPVTGVVTTGKLAGMARLDFIRRQLLSHAEGADLAVIEGYSFGAKGSAVFQLGELGGVIRLALWRMDVPYVEVAPSKLKKYATGKGVGGKSGVLVEAVKRLGYDGSDDNEADALWLLHMALDQHGLAWAKLPEVHRVALEGLAWPDLGIGKENS